MSAVFLKAPTEILDFTLNWATNVLGTDTIAASSWAINPSDMTVNSPAPSYTATTTTVWLAGGTAGKYYTITNTITTVGGRKYQESFVCQCEAVNPL